MSYRWHLTYLRLAKIYSFVSSKCSWQTSLCVKPRKGLLKSGSQNFGSPFSESFVSFPSSIIVFLPGKEDFFSRFAVESQSDPCLIEIYVNILDSSQSGDIQRIGLTTEKLEVKSSLLWAFMGCTKRVIH